MNYVLFGVVWLCLFYMMYGIFDIWEEVRKRKLYKRRLK